ncbi:plasmid replication initiator RepA [Enterobacter sp. 37]|uniref:plasmid replication initiator RepA n=1 Tax=Enterobacter sp. 37 TaxID=3085083 RepID=UPI002FC95FCD
MNDNQISVHWSDLPKDELTRFCQDVDAGTQGNFLIAPVKKLTRRKRGEHSTKAKCENPAWYRPEHYKKLSGQLGHAYNRLVKKDKETGQVSLLDALWPVLISFCDAGKHTVGMCISRLAKELSAKDAKGNVIPETEVTVSRLSRLIEEQVRFGVLGLAEERAWDRESRTWLPTYVYITPVGFQMLGVDMDKLFKEQEKKLRQSAEREQLIREGVMSEHDDVQAHSARKCWSGRKRQEALVYRRKKGAERKRANNLIKLPADERLHAMSEWIYRTLPPDEAYWCTSERLKALAIQHLYQLDLALSPPD